jgi:hypothetical protein
VRFPKLTRPGHARCQDADDRDADGNPEDIHRTVLVVVFGTIRE